MLQMFSKVGSLLLAGSMVLGCTYSAGTDAQNPWVDCQITPSVDGGSAQRFCQRNEDNIIMGLGSDRANNIQYFRRSIGTKEGSYEFSVDTRPDGSEAVMLSYSVSSTTQARNMSTFPYDFQLVRDAKGNFGFYRHGSFRNPQVDPAPADTLDQVKIVFALADEFLAHGKTNTQLAQPLDPTLAGKIDDLVINQAPTFSKEWDF